MQPWVHFIPVWTDALDDLLPKLSWADRDPGMAERIADAGQRFSSMHLSMRGAKVANSRPDCSRGSKRCFATRGAVMCTPAPPHGLCCPSYGRKRALSVTTTTCAPARARTGRHCYWRALAKQYAELLFDYSVTEETVRERQAQFPEMRRLGPDTVNCTMALGVPKAGMCQFEGQPGEGWEMDSGDRGPWDDDG